MPQQYTPFFSQMTANIGNAYMQNQKQAYMKELTQNAYMGDQRAMSELTSVNPAAAQQIQQSQRQVKQDQLAAEATRIKVEDRKRKFFTENREAVDAIFKEAAQLGTFEEALAYTEQKKAEMGDLVPEGGLEPITPELFAQIKQIHGPEAVAVSAKELAETEKIKAQTEEIKTKKDKPKKKSAVQAKAAGFYDRMVTSQAEIDKLLEKNPGFEAGSFAERGPAAVSNLFASKEYQQYNQAAMDWLRSKLRWESGAVISKEEAEDEYSTYFPVFGDDEDVIEQKKRARKVAENAMQMAAGDAPAEALNNIPQEVTTQEAYDAMPSGSLYLENGVEYRKP